MSTSLITQKCICEVVKNIQLTVKRLKIQMISDDTLITFDMFITPHIIQDMKHKFTRRYNKYGA